MDLNTILDLQYDHEQIAVRRGIYLPGTEAIRLSVDDFLSVPSVTALAYLFNPYSVLNCVGLTTTVWSNFLLAAFFWSLSRRNSLLSCLFLALETQRNFYPFVLIVPAMLLLTEGRANRVLRGVQIFYAYALVLAVLNVAGFMIVKNWSFLNSTYGFM